MTEIFQETVSLRIAMDVGHKAGEIAVALHPLAPKGLLEQTAGALVGAIEGLAVGAKQVRKGAAGVEGSEGVAPCFCAKRAGFHFLTQRDGISIRENGPKWLGYSMLRKVL